jgi:hypothetical protein
VRDILRPRCVDAVREVLEQGGACIEPRARARSRRRPSCVAPLPPLRSRHPVDIPQQTSDVARGIGKCGVRPVDEPVSSDRSSDARMCSAPRSLWAQRSLSGLRRRGTREEQFHAPSLSAGQVRRYLTHLSRRFCQIAAQRVFIVLNETLQGLGKGRDAQTYLERLAPQAGFEPATLRLTAGCSTIELLRNAAGRSGSEPKY